MNGVHDMGGMHGLGPIPYEPKEPVFHTRWESRVYAMSMAMGGWRKWSVDALRHQIELIPPADYLRMSYYEKWLAALEEISVRTGLLTREEIDSVAPAPRSPKLTPPLNAEQVPVMLRAGDPACRNVAVAPRFRAGQRVRARNINPLGATRLPRYARGRMGAIDRDHGVYLFPDTHAHSLGEHPQHVYSVRFAARELWGDHASPNDAVYIDLWDEYLEFA